MSKELENLTIVELKQLIAQKELDKDRELREKAHIWRAELDDLCRKKYEVTLQQVFTASNKPRKIRTYIHPLTGETYTHYGRGRLPKWVQELDPTVVKLIRSVK